MYGYFQPYINADEDFLAETGQYVVFIQFFLSIVIRYNMVGIIQVFQLQLKVIANLFWLLVLATKVMEFLFLMNAGSISFIHFSMFFRDLLLVQYKDKLDNILKNSCVSNILNYCRVTTNDT